jgi:hypothetical protein
MQLGRAIVLIPENQQLTTQRAADLLGVSRPHYSVVLDACIHLKDFVAYQKRRDAERKDRTAPIQLLVAFACCSEQPRFLRSLPHLIP